MASAVFRQPTVALQSHQHLHNSRFDHVHGNVSVKLVSKVRIGLSRRESFSSCKRSFGVIQASASETSVADPVLIPSNDITHGSQKKSAKLAAPDLDGANQKTLEVKRKKLAVFVSGGGSNFKAIHEACIQGSIHGDIVALITNKEGCGGAGYARTKEIPVILFPSAKGEPDNLSPGDLVAALRRLEVDFILLAGYLKLIPSELIRAYPQSILNIHPSLLPAFGGKGYYGMKVHKGVIASGARYSGPTIHVVDEHYDTGRILAQRVVPVYASDTAEELAARVLQEEHELYVEVTAALCEERIVWREDGVPLIQNRENPNEYY